MSKPDDIYNSSTEYEKNLVDGEIKHLYKYRGNIYRAIKTIYRNEIYASYPYNINDPDESKIKLKTIIEFLEKKKKDIENIYKSLSDNSINIEEYKKIVDDYINLIDDLQKYAIFSTSKRYDIPSMWSYYANENKGICIEYNFSKMRNLSQKHILEVDYSPGNKILPSIEEFPNLMNNFHVFLKKMWATKDISWNIEEEVRFIFEKMDEKEYYERKGILINVPKDAVSGIYFGTRCANDDKEFVIKSLKGMNINFYQMKFREDSFGMYSEPIKL